MWIHRHQPVPQALNRRCRGNLCCKLGFRGGNVCCRLKRGLAAAVLQQGADLLTQFHFLLTEFTGLGEILIANRGFLLLLDRPKLPVHLLGSWGQRS